MMWQGNWILYSDVNLNAGVKENREGSNNTYVVYRVLLVYYWVDDYWQKYTSSVQICWFYWNLRTAEGFGGNGLNNLATDFN